MASALEKDRVKSNDNITERQSFGQMIMSPGCSLLSQCLVDFSNGSILVKPLLPHKDDDIESIVVPFARTP